MIIMFGQAASHANQVAIHPDALRKAYEKLHAAATLLLEGYIEVVEAWREPAKDLNKIFSEEARNARPEDNAVLTDAVAGMDATLAIAKRMNVLRKTDDVVAATNKLCVDILAHSTGAGHSAEHFGKLIDLLGNQFVASAHADAADTKKALSLVTGIIEVMGSASPTSSTQAMQFGMTLKHIGLVNRSYEKCRKSLLELVSSPKPIYSKSALEQMNVDTLRM